MAKRKRTERRQAEKIARQSVPLQSEKIDDGVLKRHGSSLVRTCLVFVAIMAVLHAAVWRYSLQGEILWGSTTVKVVSYLLKMIGVTNVATENTITMRFDKWLVLPECTGLNAAILFVSFVIAYTSSLKAKFQAVAVGIPLLLFMNITRLVALGWVTEHFPKYAHVFHDFIWETVFLFLIVAMWGVWIRWMVTCEEKLAVHC